MGEPIELLRRRDALHAGYTDNEIRRMYTSGRWCRLDRGVYLDGHRFGGLDATARHRMLIEEAARRLTEHAVVSHESAAVVYGWPLWRVPLTHVNVTRDRRYGGRKTESLKVHCAPIDDIALVHGLLVTTPARTVVDLARTLSFESAVVAGDRALREFGVTADELADQVDRARGRQGIAQARRVVAVLDGHSESVGESRSRIRFGAARIKVHTQGNVFGADGRLRGRVDFFDPGGRVIGEFDGRAKYGRPGVDPGEAVFAEKVREDDFRDAGLQVVRWTWGDLDGDVVIARWQRAMTRAARAAAPRCRVEQAPLPAPGRIDRRRLTELPHSEPRYA